jgi:hypothetical protein
MNTPGKPPLTDLPVDPLSDIAWQRIEKNVMAALDGVEDAPTRLDVRPRRARHGRWIAAGAGLAAAAAVAGFLAARGDGEPSFRGTSRVVTDEAPSTVAIGDVSLTVAPASAVVVDQERERGVLIVLERGSVACEVAPRGKRPPLTVQAGDVRVEVVGTKFAVSRDGERASVVVHEGVVTVVTRGDRIPVRAGERWPAAPRAAATAPEVIESFAPDRLVDDERAPRARRPAQRAEVADKPMPSDKERYELAARLEASDPDAARAIYRELAAGGDAWAANALFAMARLEEELGNRERARALLERYLKRFPAGANAADARALLGN